MNPNASVIGPAAGPINLQLAVAPTAQRCGCLYSVQLDVGQAELVRMFARVLDMPLNAFVQDCLNCHLDDRPVPLPRHLVSKARRVARRSFAAYPPEGRARIAAVAAAHGYPDPVKYVMAEALVDYREVSLSSGRVRREFPALLFERVEEFLQVHAPIWTADPLEEPGFLDQFTDRDPWKDGAAEWVDLFERYPQLLTPPIDLTGTTEHPLPVAA